jgi:hypothetical protein
MSENVALGIAFVLPVAVSAHPSEAASCWR